MQATDTQTLTPDTAAVQVAHIPGLVTCAGCGTRCFPVSMTVIGDVPYCPDCATPPAAPVEVAPVFCIDSRARAEWLLGKLGNNAAEKARIQAQAAAMIARIDADTQSLNQRYGAQLEEWTRQELGKGKGRVKSVHTLQGTVGFRTSPARLIVADDDAALVRAHAMHLTQTTIATGAYLKAAQEELEATGALLPGVERLDAREKFSISFKGEAKSDGEGA